jgi:hypothetical protein
MGALQIPPTRSVAPALAASTAVCKSEYVADVARLRTEQAVEDEEEEGDADAGARLNAPNEATVATTITRWIERP